MNKYNKIKFPIIFWGLTLILLLGSCVDTSVENIPTSVDFRSMVKFVNNVPNETATITVDGNQVGDVASGGESSYLDTPSGSRNVKADYSNGPNVEAPLFFETDYKITVTIVEDSLGNRSFVKSLEGYY